MSHQQTPLESLRSVSQMADQNTAIGAIGAVLGYIGAEGATPASFERLVWPQRAYEGFSWRHAAKLATLAPGGGPVYKAGLQALDRAFECGLLRGSGLGHMLGSVFFPQSSGSYTLNSTDARFESHTEPARNCLWTRVVTLLPTPDASQASSLDAERSTHGKKITRTQLSVHHITLSIHDLQRTSSPALDVGTESRRCSFRTLAGMLASEVTGIILTILVAVIWRSGLAVLWMCPLLIKLLAAATALGREHLVLPGASSQWDALEEPPHNFDVQMPLESGAFLILTGPPSLILQFFRHYGHPIRSRTREVLQLALIVISACLFPIGLVLSVTAMSGPIQYLWISHQMYLVLIMYISRYMSSALWASTEEMIAEKLARSPDGTFLWADEQKKQVVKAEVQTTFHGRYGEARTHAKDLIGRHAAKSGLHHQGFSDKTCASHVAIAG